jgi:transposase InsO family protein
MVAVSRGGDGFVFTSDCRILDEPTHDATLVCDALSLALFRRDFPNGTILHSDRGSQYCSQRYQRLLANNRLRCSMGRRATCDDNAVTESFFHTLKVELVHRMPYTAHGESQYF